MTRKIWLTTTTALAACMVAGAAFAGTEDGSGQSATPNTSAQPAARMGTGTPVLQNAAPNSAAAQQTATTGVNSTTNPRSAGLSQDNLIGEVIVTAEKREANLQTIPVAVSAFTSEKRDLIGIESVVDQTNYTPGLSYNQSNDRLSLRGVGRLTNVHVADSGTTIYTDGVFLPSATQAARSPLFIERTEVLRGPQGTLSGRNAIGGSYSLISKRPTKDFSGEVRVDFGNYDVERLDGTVSVPLTDNLRTRFNFTRNYQGDGFQKNLSGTYDNENGNRDEEYYEAQLEGEVGKLDFWLQWNKNVWHDSAPPGTQYGGSFAPNDTTLGTGALISPTFGFSSGTNLKFFGPVAGNPVLATGDLGTEQHDVKFQDTLHDNNTGILHLTYHFPSFDLRYVGGWSRYHYQWRDDGDGTSIQSFTVPLNPTAAPFTVVPGFGGVNCYQLQALGACGPATVSFAGNTTTYDEIEEYYSHEFTIASTSSGPFQYIAGLYFYHEKGSNPVVAYAPTTPQLAKPLLPTGAAAAPDPFDEYAYSNSFFSIVSKAAYAQLDYNISDTLKVTTGLRYTQDDKKSVEEERFVYYGSNAVAPYTLQGAGSLAPALDITTLALGGPINGAPQQGVIGSPYYDAASGTWRRNLRDGSNALTGTLGVEWTPERRTLVYAKYSRGYKAFGLFATQLPTAFSSFPYSKPETIDNFEVGLKRDWSRRLQTNLVAFYDPYQNAQVPLSVQQGANPAYSLLYNVPRSILQGVELETTWVPIDKFTILFTYAYLDAHVTKGCCVSDPNDPSATQPGAQPAGTSSQGAVDSITGLPTRGQDLKGQQLPFSPKNKVAINFSYNYTLGNLGDLIPSVSYLWRDEQYSSFFNRSYNYAPSRDQVDLRLTFRDAKNRFDVIGYARNVGDNRSLETVSGGRTTTGLIYSNYTLVDPRTYGVELRYRF